VWEQRIDSEAGSRVHDLVGMALASGVDPFVAARELFRVSPIGGSLATSVRLRCASAASVYVRRCRPEGWELVGVEERLEAAIADLVFANGNRIFIDELKSGLASPDSARVQNQVQRLAAGGRTRWGRNFVGVRTVPLAAPARTWFVDAAGRPVDLPADLAIR
jgi:hypothetical protein